MNLPLIEPSLSAIRIKSEREKSAVWKMVFEDLWMQRKSRARIATELNLPESELENLVFGLAADPGASTETTSQKGLHLVK